MAGIKVNGVEKGVLLEHALEFLSVENVQLNCAFACAGPGATKCIVLHGLSNENTDALHTIGGAACIILQ